MKIKKISFVATFISATFLILFLTGNILPHGLAVPNLDGYDQVVKRKTIQRAQVIRSPVVQQIIPEHISLIRGSSETLTLKGSYLNGITSAQVLRNDNSNALITAEIRSSRTNFEIEIDLKASPNAHIEGGYQLKLTAGEITISIPNKDISFGLAVVVPSKAKLPGVERPVKPEKIQTIKPKDIQPSARDFPCMPIKLETKDFHLIIAKAIGLAQITVNTCESGDRYSRIYIPNVYGPLQEQLDRLDYKFTKNEVDESTTRVTTGVGAARDRRTHIRACVDDWRSQQWEAGIAGSKFYIHIAFWSYTIKTRALEQRTTLGIWSNKWDWRDSGADNAIEDHRFILWFSVSLIPTVSGEKLSYEVDRADAQVVQDVLEGYGEYMLRSVEELKIVNYKNYVKETLRRRIGAVFHDNEVRSRIEDELTAYVKSGDHEDCKIVGVVPNGNYIQVNFATTK